MAAMHIRAYREVGGVTIGAICDLDPNRLNGDFSDVLGNIDSGDPVKLDMSQVKAYQDFNELLADKSIDVIDICTPTRTHLLMTIMTMIMVAVTKVADTQNRGWFPTPT